MTRSENSSGTVEEVPLWSIAIFAARESAATLDEVVHAAAEACSTNDAVIDVLVNGNQKLACDLVKRLDKDKDANWPQTNVRINVWFIELGDKAQTWNTYVHQLYRGSKIAFFVDGYARPNSNAFLELCLGLRLDRKAQAASGVPTMGLSAQRLTSSLLRNGGIHGNLFALTGETMNEIRRRGFRLPMGLYRTDSLIGAAINFKFDPSRNDWDSTQIRVQPSATWRFRPLRWWRMRDIRTHLKRMARQSQGVLENMAVTDLFVRCRRPLEALPSTARELVLSWWNGDNGPRWYQVLAHPFWLLTMRRLSTVQVHSPLSVAPKLIYRRPNMQSDLQA